MLITLVIIGVIAALTLPTLIGKYQKHQTVVGLKKAYSEINNAIRMSVAENGDVSNWSWELDETWVNKYLVPYFKIVNTMTMQEAKEKAGGTYYEISGNPEENLAIIFQRNTTKVITLSSGAQVWLGEPASTYPIIFDSKYFIYIDINGYKKPNTFGKDVFVFILWRNSGKVLLNSTCDIETSIIIRNPAQLKGINGSCGNYACKKDGRGMWCGALIQAEGWEIKDDYPW